MRWGGHVACVGGMSNEWVNLVVQCDEGKR